VCCKLHDGVKSEEKQRPLSLEDIKVSIIQTLIALVSIPLVTLAWSVDLLAY